MQRVKGLFQRLHPVQFTGMPILDQYFKNHPSAQNAVDIFAGEWASSFGAPHATLKAGKALLFNDPRLTWALEELGGVAGRSVVELGPLEAAHTTMLERAGARSIVAVEANARAYMKCLVTKEIYGLSTARFLAGDCMEFLRHTKERYDVVVAHGILYHMAHPAELIKLLASASDRVTIWTHYYDANSSSLQKRRNFSKTPIATTFEGFNHTLYRQHYGRSLWLNNFYGGMQKHSHWMTRQGILDCLAHYGFKDIKIAYDNPLDEPGPSFTLVALKAT